MMQSEAPAVELLVCAGAFASVLLFKYFISRETKESKTPDSQNSFPQSTLDLINPRDASKPVPQDKRNNKERSVPNPQNPEDPERTRRPSTSKTQGFSSVIGLDNLGNTCYLNSLIQAVVCIPEFLVWLQDARRTVCLPQIPRKKNPTNSQVETFCQQARMNKCVPLGERRLRNFFHSLIRLTDVLDHRTMVAEDCYAASSLINAMAEGSGGSGLYNFQQDPDELFLFMINLLSKTWAFHQLPLFDADLIGDHSRGPEKCQVAVGAAGPHIENITPTLWMRPWVTQPFQGLIYHDLVCVVCKKSRPQPLELFNSLSLSFPMRMVRGEVYLLENLIKSYFAPDDLDAVECPKCPQMFAKAYQNNDEKPLSHPLTPHVKRTSIARLPKILCIHIRRAVWSGTDSWKRRDPVNFPATLFIGEFLWLKHVGADANGYHKSSCCNGSSVKASEGASDGIQTETSYSRIPSQGVYSLKSVVVHVGESSTRGHIVAYRKGPVGSRNADCWYYTSDHIVRKTTWHEVQAADPYILFYELRR